MTADTPHYLLGQAERNPLWQALDDIDDIIAEHDIGDLVRRAVGIDDGSDPIRLHDCGRFHRPSEPCPEAGS